MNIYLILIFAQNFPAQTIQSQVREAALWLWAHAAVAEDPGSVTSTHVTSVPGGPVPYILCPLYSPSSGAQKLIKAPRCAHTDTQTHAHVHTNQTEKKIRTSSSYLTLLHKLLTFTVLWCVHLLITSLPCHLASLERRLCKHLELKPTSFRLHLPSCCWNSVWIRWPFNQEVLNIQVFQAIRTYQDDSWYS